MGNQLNKQVEDLFSSQDPNPIYDTQEIIDVYLQRPQSMSLVSFGFWFDAAHCLGDRDLQLAITNSESRRIIVAKQYTRLPLEKLHTFNANCKLLP